MRRTASMYLPMMLSASSSSSACSSSLSSSFLLTPRLFHTLARRCLIAKAHRPFSPLGMLSRSSIASLCLSRPAKIYPIITATTNTTTTPTTTTTLTTPAIANIPRIFPVAIPVAYYHTPASPPSS
ncbi:hypothetical protein GGS24DRAFT_203384 [Hypoxylon argillaceum]|nr:hypothetical protein GGS24DRAFT_203384 [Hypoxylon argillaceum]KAI1155153.1 hypothetical protein F4825DRAFT_99723 [Nemania diffusa]